MQDFGALLPLTSMPLKAILKVGSERGWPDMVCAAGAGFRPSTVLAERSLAMPWAISSVNHIEGDGTRGLSVGDPCSRGLAADTH